MLIRSGELFIIANLSRWGRGLSAYAQVKAAQVFNHGRKIKAFLIASEDANSLRHVLF